MRTPVKGSKIERIPVSFLNNGNNRRSRTYRRVTERVTVSKFQVWLSLVFRVNHNNGHPRMKFVSSVEFRDYHSLSVFTFNELSHRLRTLSISLFHS